MTCETAPGRTHAVSRVAPPKSRSCKFPSLRLKPLFRRLPLGIVRLLREGATLGLHCRSSFTSLRTVDLFMVNVTDVNGGTAQPKFSVYCISVFKKAPISCTNRHHIGSQLPFGPAIRPYPSPLQGGICLFRDLLPAVPSACLAVSPSRVELWGDLRV